jgi:lipopolysaccharide heptosyltransferase II
VIAWPSVNRVLVVRLRSIGDTVLATPSLTALKRFLPNAEIDILLEDWVAPLLVGHKHVANVITAGKTLAEKLNTARAIGKRKYDVVFNLHGGSTSTFLTYATGAKHRVGYEGYRYPFLYTDLLSSSADFWERSPTHSAEQQLALLGSVGVPVDDLPRSSLPGNTADVSGRPVPDRFALFHPTAAFETKTWPIENFARVAEQLYERGIETVAVAAKNEPEVLEKLRTESGIPLTTFDDLTLPEITALASKAKLFVGNDSGIAHIAAALNTPTVVIFGSSNRDHWYPWTDAPNEIVFNEFACQPCPGYECKEFGDPQCIKSVTVAQVIDAMERVLSEPGVLETG